MSLLRSNTGMWTLKESSACSQNGHLFLSYAFLWRSEPVQADYKPCTPSLQATKSYLAVFRLCTLVFHSGQVLIDEACAGLSINDCTVTCSFSVDRAHHSAVMMVEHARSPAFGLCLDRLPAHHQAASSFCDTLHEHTRALIGPCWAGVQ